MRIAVLHNLLPGGAHRRLREQMERLDGEVLEICLATAQPIRPDAHVIALSPAAPRLPAPLRPPFRYADLAALARAWRRAGARARELGAEVVFANPCRFLQAPAGLLSSSAPALYFCDEPRRVDHDPAAVRSRRGLTRPLYGPMYAIERRLDAAAARAAARIATNSAFTARELERAYGRPAEVIGLGVSDAFLAVEPRAPEHVLSVGTLIPRKGHDLAVAAVAAARSRWPLIVVAPRPGETEAGRLRALARDAGVELELRVGIPDAELASLYAGAQATLYLAEREPFGLASLEAQACGSPVIVAAEGGLPETLAPGQSRWAVERRAGAVAERLDALEAPAARAEAAIAGRAHARESTWERSATRVRALLAELAGARGRAGHGRASDAGARG